MDENLLAKETKVPVTFTKINYIAHIWCYILYNNSF